MEEKNGSCFFEMENINFGIKYINKNHRFFRKDYSFQCLN